MQENRVSPWLLGIGIFVVVLVLLFGCASAGPSGLSANSVSGGIEVSWQPSSSANVVGYNVYRSTQSGSIGQKINPVMITDSKYVDRDVENGLTYYYTVRTVNSAGAEDSNTQQASILAKTKPPTDLQIQINGGNEYTSNPQVTLYVSADGATKCRFSNDGVVWADWENYAANKSWTLPSGDGQKEVYYICEDDFGNVATPTSATIYLDTTPPTITLTSPKQGGQYAGSFDLVFSASDPIEQTLTCSGDISGAPIAIGVVDVGSPQTVTINAAEGAHTLNLECKDHINSANASATFTIVNKPSVEMEIESGAGYVAIPRVNLDVKATNAAQCRFSNDGNTWGSWLTYSTVVQWSLSAGDGTKTVYAQCQGANGQSSDVVTDTIILDTTPPPYVSMQINNGNSWTNSRNVVLGLYCFSAKQSQFSNDGQMWSGWESYGTSRVWTLSPGDGTKYVYFECQDSNGKLVGTTSATILYSQKEPNPPSSLDIEINDGDSYTSSRSVDLTLDARDANQCRFSNENSDWSKWYDYDTEMSWKLSSGDGRKTVYYQCQNDFGTVSTHASIYLETGPPPPITNLRATSDDDYIYLRWSSPGSSAVRYNIYRSTEGMGLLTKVATASSTSWRDGNVVEGLAYSYMVRAVDNAGNEGGNSNVVEAEINRYGPLMSGGSSEPESTPA